MSSISVLFKILCTLTYVMIESSWYKYVCVCVCVCTNWPQFQNTVKSYNFQDFGSFCDGRKFCLFCRTWHVFVTIVVVVVVVVAVVVAVVLVHELCLFSGESHSKTSGQSSLFKQSIKSITLSRIEMIFPISNHSFAHEFDLRLIKKIDNRHIDSIDTCVVFHLSKRTMSGDSLYERRIKWSTQKTSQRCDASTQILTQLLVSKKMNSIWTFLRQLIPGKNVIKPATVDKVTWTILMKKKAWIQIENWLDFEYKLK